MDTIVAKDGPDGTATALRRHPGGRPVKWTAEAIEAEGEALLAWLQEDKSQFWVKDFAVERGYGPQRFSEWVKVSPQFSDAYKMAMAVQESRLVSKGLEGKGQAMAIFTLKNNHGWRDKQEIEQTSVNLSANMDITSMDSQEARDRVRRLLENYDRCQPPELPAGESNES